MLRSEGPGCARARVPWRARSPRIAMLQELEIRREETATVRLLWDDRTELVWLHVQEDAGAEHVVGVPSSEAQDAFHCPSLYIGFERALAAVGSAAPDLA
jgi:hypothetical protein